MAHDEQGHDLCEFARECDIEIPVHERILMIRPCRISAGRRGFMLCRYVPDWENGIRLTSGRASFGPDLVMTRTYVLDDLDRSLGCFGIAGIYITG
jgi:hypothetical protein